MFVLFSPSSPVRLVSDVIELSSGDDDALQISSGSDDEDKDERSGTPGTDESSGAHANDAHNQPDPQGRVLVNMNHPPEEADLFLAPQLARAVKPHQVPLTLWPGHKHSSASQRCLCCPSFVLGKYNAFLCPNCIHLFKHTTMPPMEERARAMQGASRHMVCS